MHRSELTIDLAALRRNARTLLAALEGAELWAVVKSNAYGHGAADVAGAALGSGATALCVATVPEGLDLRREFPTARIIVMGPAGNREVAYARDARLELVIASDEIPRDVRVHLKLDTGMGRWGLAELPEPPVEVVGLMSHLATGDTAAALRYPSARFDAARCGIALYGLSPFGTDPAEDGLEPVLSWTSHIAQTRLLRPGESTGYGRRFVAERDTWIGIVPVGYADGFRRDLTGTHVRVGGEIRRVVGTVSMDALAVVLEAELPVATPVVLIGRGVLAEAHARVAETITYELVCGISSDPSRARRIVVDG